MVPAKEKVEIIEEELFTTRKMFTIPEEHYEGFVKVRFSPDNRRFAYLVREDDDKEFIVLDGVEQRRFDEIKNLSFAPDSQSIIYNTRDGRDLWMIVEEVR